MKTFTLTWLTGAALVLLATSAVAQQRTMDTGPMLPPALRKHSGEVPASGAALRLQAINKLKLRFEQADLDASGSITRDEAQAAGLGYVVAHFDEIDSGKRGKVSFDDLRKYMQQRRAAQQ
jgi:hypothetical protein